MWSTDIIKRRGCKENVRSGTPQQDRRVLLMSISLIAVITAGITAAMVAVMDAVIPAVKKNSNFFIKGGHLCAPAS